MSNTPQTYIHMEAEILQLKRALARYEQTELPEEPERLSAMRVKVAQHNFNDATLYHEVAESWKKILDYAAALRAHAARLTVERDEEKERAEKAEREIERLNSPVLKSDWQEAMAEITNLTKRAEENARDAERYRYCRDTGLLDGHVCGYEDKNDLDESEVGTAEYKLRCDLAIDAARSEEGKK